MLTCSHSHSNDETRPTTNKQRVLSCSVCYDEPFFQLEAENRRCILHIVHVCREPLPSDHVRLKMNYLPALEPELKRGKPGSALVSDSGDEDLSHALPTRLDRYPSCGETVPPPPRTTNTILVVSSFFPYENWLFSRVPRVCKVT